MVGEITNTSDVILLSNASPATVVTVLPSILVGKANTLGFKVVPLTNPVNLTVPSPLSSYVYILSSI